MRHGPRRGRHVAGCRSLPNQSADLTARWSIGPATTATAPIACYRATSLQQVQDFVRQHAQLKVLGTRHCFNGIADSTVDLLSLREMDQVVALDPAARTVTVQAGMSYGQLCPYLHEHGFALHNLASLPHISDRGSVRHGDAWLGRAQRQPRDGRLRLEIVTADGGVLTLSREKDGSTFLGQRRQPRRPRRGHQGHARRPAHVRDAPGRLSDLPMAQVRDHFDEIAAAGYSVSLFTDWQKERVNEVWVKRRVEKGTELTAARGVLRRARRRPGTCIRSSSSRPRTARSRWAFRAPGTSGCRTSAWGSRPAAARSCSPSTSCPGDNAVEAILAVERLRDHVSPHLMISELRTIDADQLWMSPCYNQASLAIHFTWKQDWDVGQQACCR